MPRKKKTSPPPSDGVVGLRPIGFDLDAYLEQRERDARPPTVSPAFPSPEPAELTPSEHAEFIGVLAELARRQADSLALYEPMPKQEAFHRSDASARIIRGGNRGGKTLAACVEVARAVCNRDPHGKYPTKGRVIIVGKDLIHCSKVIYKKLFKPSAFQIIRDLETGLWRAFKPSDPSDAARAHEAKDAPPLISRRMYSYRDMSWENKREEILKTVRLKNGWEITFFSSFSAPPQGWDVHLVLFDEEIDHPGWYPEMRARLIDHCKIDTLTGRPIGGKFIWSATPQAGTQILYDLSQRASEHVGDQYPPIEEFHVTLLENDHLSERGKQEFIAENIHNEDEYRVRVLGDFAIVGSRVYPEFTPKGVHGMKAFEIPDNWTRYAFVDPGRQVCAVLFAAVPDPKSEHNGRVFFFDELYIKKCNAKIFGQRMKEKIGQHLFRAFIIDGHESRKTEAGSGKTIEEQYSEALKENGIRSEITGHGFEWGSDDGKAGELAVRSGLHLHDGKSRFVFFWEKLGNLLWEMERYCYKRVPGTNIPTDQPIKRDDHLCDTLRYAAMHPLKWHKPKVNPRPVGWTNEILKKKREKRRRESGWGGSIKVG